MTKPTSDMLIEKYLRRQQDQRERRCSMGKAKRNKPWSSEWGPRYLAE
jgi:hypothetical protein